MLDFCQQSSIIGHMKHKNAVQLAHAIGYTRQGVYKLLESGVVKGERVNGRYWIIKQKEFDRIIEFYHNRVRHGYKHPFHPSKVKKT